ncbi:MAG: mercury transporter [Clostridiales bacterium]|jgi:hypothetical protein|nr:mercury transporter [Clostridiales bacterium]
MTYIDEISVAVLALIRAGAVFRAIFCLIRLSTAEEESPQFKKRLRNTVVFYIIAESAFVLKDIFVYYYS